MLRSANYIVGLAIAGTLLLTGCGDVATHTLTYRMDRSAPGADPTTTSAQVAVVLNKRLQQTSENYGVAKALDKDRISVKLYTIDGKLIDSIKQYLTTTGRAELRVLASPQAREHLRRIEVAQASPTTAVIVDEQVSARWCGISDKMLQQLINGSAVIRRNPNGSSSVLAVVGKLDVLSEHFEEATTSKDPQFGPVVAFKMTKSGAKQLGEITGNYMPDYSSNMKFQLGIFVDDELIAAPNINDRITTSGQITGSFKQADVDRIAAIMNAGGIPIHLILESESNP